MAAHSLHAVVALVVFVSFATAHSVPCASVDMVHEQFSANGPPSRWATTFLNGARLHNNTVQLLSDELFSEPVLRPDPDHAAVVIMAPFETVSSDGHRSARLTFSTKGSGGILLAEYLSSRESKTPVASYWTSVAPSDGFTDHLEWYPIPSSDTPLLLRLRWETLSISELPTWSIGDVKVRLDCRSAPETHKCAPNLCKNGGTCVTSTKQHYRTAHSVQCLCTPGFLGELCETSLNDQGSERREATLVRHRRCGNGYFEVKKCANSVCWSKNTYCDPCNAGHFCVNKGRHICEPGKHQPYKTRHYCFDCPGGRYAATEMQFHCRSCETGRFSSTAATVCTNCVAGKYAPAGRSACIDCPAGKYQGSAESGSCHNCPSGFFSDQRATRCDQRQNECPAGSMCPGAVASELCVPGKYQNERRQSTCINCTPGKYQSARGSTTCSDCSPGYATGYSSNQCDNDATRCSLGHYCAGAVAQQRCTPGYYQDMLQQTKCKRCAKGKYASNYAMHSCPICPAFKYQPSRGGTDCLGCHPTLARRANNARTACVCRDGTVSSVGCYVADVVFKCDPSGGSIIASVITTNPGTWKVTPEKIGRHQEGTSTTQTNTLILGGTTSANLDIIGGVLYPGEQFHVNYQNAVNLFVTIPCGCSTEDRLCNRRNPRYRISLTPDEIDDGAHSFQPRQKGGFIYFKWLVNSKCAVSYEFVRRATLAGQSQRFAKPIEVPQSVCSDVMTPSDVHDNLVASELVLGREYHYCVTGTSSNYQSKEVCSPWTIHFDSKIFIDVITLKGEHPVEGVSIAWKIEDVTCGTSGIPSGTAALATDKLGQTFFHINLPCLTNENYIVTVTASKNTQGIDHIFKCKDGSVCNSRLIEAEHLNFEHRLEFLDATTAPVQGSVKIPMAVYGVGPTTGRRSVDDEPVPVASSSHGETSSHSIFALPDPASSLQHSIDEIYSASSSSTTPVMSDLMRSALDHRRALSTQRRAAPVPLFHADTAYVGAEFVSSDATTLDACAKECGTIAACFGWTFLAKATLSPYRCRLQVSDKLTPVFELGSSSACSATNKLGVCKQKGCVPGWTGIDCTTVIVHENTVYSGSPSTKTTATSAKACRILCKDKSDCTAWSFSPPSTCDLQIDSVWTNPGGIRYAKGAFSGCSFTFAQKPEHASVCREQAACPPGLMGLPSCTSTRRMLSTALVPTSPTLADLRAPAASADACASLCTKAGAECTAWSYCPSCYAKMYPCALFTKVTTWAKRQSHVADAVSSCSATAWVSDQRDCEQCPPGYAGVQCNVKVFHRDAEPAFYVPKDGGSPIQVKDWMECALLSTKGAVMWSFRSTGCYLISTASAKSSAEPFWYREGVTSGCSPYGLQRFGEKVCSHEARDKLRHIGAVAVEASVEQTKVTSEALCAEVCDHTEKCQAWNFNVKHKRCALQLSGEPLFQKPATISQHLASYVPGSKTAAPVSISSLAQHCAVLNGDGSVFVVKPSGVVERKHFRRPVVALYDAPRYGYSVAVLDDGGFQSWGNLRMGSKHGLKVLGVYTGENYIAVIEDEANSKNSLTVYVKSPTTGRMQASLPMNNLDPVHVATADNSLAVLTGDGRISFWPYVPSLFGRREVAEIDYMSALPWSPLQDMSLLARPARVTFATLPPGSPSSGYKKVVATKDAFCALHMSGQVVAAGPSASGGVIPSSVLGFVSSNIKDIVATRGACAALRDDGRVFVWGAAVSGGDLPAEIQPKVYAGIASIYATDHAFAALSEHGSVVAWGVGSSGGEVSATLQKLLNKGIDKVLVTPNAFGAVASDGKTYVWGLNPHIEHTLGVAARSIVALSDSFFALSHSGEIVSTDPTVSVPQSPPKVTSILGYLNGVVSVTEGKGCYDPSGRELVERGDCVAADFVSACSQRNTAVKCKQAPCEHGAGGRACQLSLLREGLVWRSSGATILSHKVVTAEFCSSSCERATDCMGWSFLSEVGSGVASVCRHYSVKQTDLWKTEGNTAIQLIPHANAASGCSRRWLLSQELALKTDDYRVRERWCEEATPELMERVTTRATIAAGSLFQERLALSPHACALLCDVQKDCAAWTHRSSLCHMFNKAPTKLLYDDGVGGLATTGIRVTLASMTPPLVPQCPPGRTGEQCEKSYIHENAVYTYGNSGGTLESLTSVTLQTCAEKCDARSDCEWWTWTTTRTCTMWRSIATGDVFGISYDTGYTSACSRTYMMGKDKTQRQCWREPPTPVTTRVPKCAVPKAEVCAYDWYTGNKVVCETTSSTGAYTLHVPIGLTVEFVATFGMHVLELDAAAVSPSTSVTMANYPACTNTPSQKQPYMIVPETGLTSVDFDDKTSETIEITVAGGVRQCNIDLGTAEIIFVPKVTCDVPDASFALVQTEVTKVHTVPAALFDIKLNKVYERPEVAPYFARIQQRIRADVDLRQFDERQEETQVGSGLAQGHVPQEKTRVQLYCDNDEFPTAAIETVPQSDSNEATNALSTAEIESRERAIRFEYHPRPHVSVVVLDTARASQSNKDACAAVERTFPTILGNVDNSEAPEQTKVAVSAREVFGDESDPTNVCHFVPGTLKIVNKLATTTAITAASANMATGEVTPVNAEQVADATPVAVSIDTCGDAPGCDAVLSVSVQDPLPVSEKPPVVLVTGDTLPPERNEAVMSSEKPYTRPFYATLNTPGWDTLPGINHVEVDVVILGEVLLSAFFSLQLPEYLPLMVVRDPPGGNSVTEVASGKSHAWATSASLSLGGSIGVGASLATTSKNKVDFCAGLGAMVCKNGASIKMKLGLGRREAETDEEYEERQRRELSLGGAAAAAVNAGKGTKPADDDDAEETGDGSLGYTFSTAQGIPSANWEKERMFSFEYSVSTSDDPASAGRPSDMFLVPSLSVKLSRSLIIKYDAASCSVVATPKVALSQEGDKVLAWKSDEDIRYRMLPDVLRQLAYEVREGGKLATMVKLANSVNGWSNLLAYNAAVHHIAGVKGSDWPDFVERFKVAPDSLSESTEPDAIALDAVFSATSSRGVLPTGVPALKNFNYVTRQYIEVFKVFKQRNSKLYGSSNTGLPPINSLKLQSGVKEFDGDSETDLSSERNGLTPDEWNAHAGDEPQEWTEDTPIKWRRRDAREKRNALPEFKATPLNEYNGVSFSGGGSSITYTASGENSEQHTKSSAYTHEISLPALKLGFEFSLGVGLAIGLEIPTGLMVEHGSSSTGGVVHSNAVSFSLGDPDIDDQFDVLIFYDPLFGTPVFYTLSGRSMCVHEPNTVPREQVRLILASWPPGPVMPDQPAIYEVILVNDSPTNDGSDYRLSVPSADNRDNLAIMIDGDTFSGARIMKDFEPGSVRMAISVHRAPGHYKYDPLKLRFVSDCEYPAGMPSGRDVIGATIDIPVEFLEPCPPVDFAEDLAADAMNTFTVNTHTAEKGDWQNKHKNQLRVVALNKNVVEQSWTADGTRITSVVLEYRVVGGALWSPATMIMADETAELPVEGGLASLQTMFGYATVYWDVASIPDGTYDLRLRTLCKPANMAQPPPGINEQSSHVVRGTIDRQAPRVFGHFAEPADGKYSPGKSVSITFDEPIDCRTPYLFTVTAASTIAGATYKWKSTGANELLVVCQGRSVLVEFGAAVPWAKVEGAAVRMTVYDIKDVAGNAMPTSMRWEFDMVGVTLATVRASVQHIKLRRRLALLDANDATAARERCALAVESELVRLLQVDHRHFQVEVDSDNSGYPDLTIAIHGNDRVSAASLVARLYETLWADNNSTEVTPERTLLAETEWLAHADQSSPVRVVWSENHEPVSALSPLSGSTGFLSTNNIVAIVLCATLLLCVLVAVRRSHQSHLVVTQQVVRQAVAEAIAGVDAPGMDEANDHITEKSGLLSRSRLVDRLDDF